MISVLSKKERCVKMTTKISVLKLSNHLTWWKCLLSLGLDWSRISIYRTDCLLPHELCISINSQRKVSPFSHSRLGISCQLGLSFSLLTLYVAQQLLNMGSRNNCWIFNKVVSVHSMNVHNFYWWFFEIPPFVTHWFHIGLSPSLG